VLATGSSLGAAGAAASEAAGLVRFVVDPVEAVV